MLIWWKHTYYKEKHRCFSSCSEGDRLEVNADRTKCIVMSWDQNAGRSHDMKIDDVSFERVEQFKYFRTTLTEQNHIQEEIMSRLQSWTACYHSVQNLLSSSLLPKNIKPQIHRTIILPFALYGCETWSLTLRKERRLRVFENRVLRRILWPQSDEVTGEWRKLHREDRNDLYSSSNIIRLIKSRRMSLAGHVTRTVERRGFGGETWGKEPALNTQT